MTGAARKLELSQGIIKSLEFRLQAAPHDILVQPPEGGTPNNFPQESHMNTIWQDLRYGARMLLKRPSFTLIAVSMLALGIGANTAIFSVVSAVMLRSLPYREPDRLVTLSGADQNGRLYATVPARYLDWRARNDVFTDVAAIEDAEISNRPRFFMTGEDRPERVRGAMVSNNFFSVLGVEPR
jgi:putative ABC transport system permease protein